MSAPLSVLLPGRFIADMIVLTTLLSRRMHLSASNVNPRVLVLNITRPRGNSSYSDSPGTLLPSRHCWNKCALRIDRKHIRWDDRYMRWETSPHACSRQAQKLERTHCGFRVLWLGFFQNGNVGPAVGSLAAERWRRVHGHAVRSWLAVIGEIEALICLANYSYEHPDDPFPEFVQGAACFDATDLGHPLVAAAKCVRNDVRLSDGKRVFLVSGSNMSGKSTLLRTVGVNAVLAMAGAPVRAQGLRLTPLHVGASIRINDSLQDGSSRFYSEITRLRKLFDLAGDGGPSLLFLLDELLQGTNSHDRRIGAEGVVCALLNRGAIGLVSTHDLALAEIGGSLNGQLSNVHFQEEFENGRMHFDYKLRAGVVTKSNGLALMRSIGLDV